MVGTGTNYVALKEAHPERVIAADFKRSAGTADGTVMAAPRLLTQVTVGLVVAYDMSAVEPSEGRRHVVRLDISFLFDDRRTSMRAAAD